MGDADKPSLKVAVIPVTPFQQNCSVVWCERTKRAAVVDPGGDVGRILGALQKVDATVEAIWLTHGHIDHAGGAAQLKEELGGVPLIGPDRRDQFLLEQLEDSGRKYQMAGVRNILPDRWLSEGETVTLGDLSFDLYHCPGHTPGSLVFVDAASRFALVGDVLFAGSVGRTDFPYGDPDALIRAIRQKLFPLGDDITFLPGHGPAGTFGEERRSNPFAGERA